MRRILYLFIWFVTTSLQAQSNEGTDFWFAFMEHVDVRQNTMVVMITSRYDANVTVTMPGIGFIKTESVAANQVTIIQLPTEAENIGSEALHKLGVNVQSNLPVSVYIHQYANRRSDATMVLPTDVLGNEYYSINYTGFSMGGQFYPSEFVLVGVEDNTNATITVKSGTKAGRGQGGIISVTLNKGDTYQVQAAGTADMTGSHIVADKKIAVLSGNAWTAVPSGCGTWDNLLEMLPPVATWGRKYISTPSKLRYDIFRIIAQENQTSISINGTDKFEIVLDKGEFYQYSASEPKYIEATKPILVGHFFPGKDCSSDNTNGDPSMLILNSIEQTRDSVVMYNSSFQAILENYINVIMLSSDVDFVNLDGKPIRTWAKVDTIIGNPKYAFARVIVGTGAHQIFTRGCGVIAYAYGYGFAESYAYGGGASYKTINLNPIIDGGCVGAELDFDEGLDSVRYKLSWDFGDGTTTQNSTFNKVYQDTGYYKVKLILEDKCLEESTSFEKDILISKRKLVDVDSLVEACEGLEVKLMVSDVEDAEFEWHGPNGFMSKEQNPSIKDLNLRNLGTYSVVGNFFGCNSFPAETKINVLLLPKPNLGENIYFCPREENYILDPGDFSSYLWNNGLEDSKFVSNLEGLFYVKVTGDNGCENVDSVSTKSVCLPYVAFPNVIKREAMTKGNNVFMPEIQDVNEAQFVIFDRWGNLVFQTNELGIGWDGTMAGQACSLGVYVYSYQYIGLDKVGNLKLYTKTGTFTLLQ